ncbi:hypothetical protein, partial [Vibrio metoecus]
NANDDANFSKIIDTLDPEDLSFSYENISFPSFSDSEFEGKMFNKGLKSDNVHLFVRGHDFSGKINKLCENIVEKASSKVKNELEKNHPNKSAQFVKEFYNKRRTPDAVARGKDIKCSFALPKIIADINAFKDKHIKKELPSFQKIAM